MDQPAAERDDGGAGGPPAIKPFGIFDMMVIVAATAVTLAAAQFRLAHRPVQPLTSISNIVFIAIESMNLLLTATTFSLAIMLAWRLRRRDRSRILSPGHIVIGAAAAGSLVMVIRIWVKALNMSQFSGLSQSALDPLKWVLGDDNRSGFVLIGVWIVLILIGHRPPVSDWLDRAGRILAWAWLFKEFATPPLLWASLFLRTPGA